MPTYCEGHPIGRNEEALSGTDRSRGKDGLSCRQGVNPIRGPTTQKGSSPLTGVFGKHNPFFTSFAICVRLWSISPA